MNQIGTFMKQIYHAELYSGQQATSGTDGYYLMVDISVVTCTTNMPMVFNCCMLYCWCLHCVMLDISTHTHTYLYIYIYTHIHNIICLYIYGNIRVIPVWYISIITGGHNMSAVVDLLSGWRMQFLLGSRRALIKDGGEKQIRVIEFKGTWRSWASKMKCVYIYIYMYNYIWIHT